MNKFLIALLALVVFSSFPGSAVAADETVRMLESPGIGDESLDNLVAYKLVQGISYKYQKGRLTLTVNHSRDYMDLVVTLQKSGGKPFKFKKRSMSSDFSSVFIYAPKKGVDPGRYTVTCSVYERGERKDSSKYNINVKVPVYLTFSKVSRMKDGSLRFYLNQSGIKGKTIHWEFYNRKGRRVHSVSVKSSKSFGNAYANWNGWPDSGLQLPNGTYTLKYWADGLSPKSKTLNLKFSRT